MKKKVFIAFVLVALAMTAGYFYMYRGHRNIASEDSAFTLTTAALLKEFTNNPEMANARYSNMVIEVTGQVSGTDGQAHSLTVDGKIYATLEADQKIPVEGAKITLKGRFLGYDDLLDEFRMDQATIID